MRLPVPAALPLLSCLAWPLAAGAQQPPQQPGAAPRPASPAEQRKAEAQRLLDELAKASDANAAAGLEARQLAPNSQVAGKATVFVFPDLNTGNTTHKAVQRSADCVSLGPMLQGLRKPVNDLPRGAQVDDIVYTIALTAIQAANRPMDI